MSAPNMGLLFYKEYYEEYFNEYEHYSSSENESEKYFKNKNKEILDVKLLKGENCIPIGKDNLFFKTSYPGLLVGSGYDHGIKVKNEFKIGFQFDYTTGLPIIPGSSVKGILRSVFNNKKDKDNGYIKYIIKSNKEKFQGINIEILTQEDFINIEREIFDGIKNGKALPIYERDIFFDAIIDFERTKKEISVSNGNSKSEKILGDDFITPHKNPLKNPIPIMFLKVMPNVVWNFQFDLKDRNTLKDGRNFSATQKLFLFRQIILDMGVGAKTNVGYGRFDDKYGQDELEKQ
ncbi:type III-B CRISPR module RAMP protein Cmr6 [Clostridium pasteurianum]|uniref:type III-B CRISPR module RAMP protein Cmr6 n=1 Tax=Clostridium pasteurianum TaxID=1501 RepID=UPI002260F0F0|nr:type III-B CRISPR module RAMP protein Cmr6 [Clostridium pasteurianum]UZW14966.1 type III-B CRISPR module RAMP protein Cmr6 [Clostridium pasteurianum]